MLGCAYVVAARVVRVECNVEWFVEGFVKYVTSLCGSKGLLLFNS